MCPVHQVLKCVNIVVHHLLLICDCFINISHKAVLNWHCHMVSSNDLLCPIQPPLSLKSLSCKAFLLSGLPYGEWQREILDEDVLVMNEVMHAVLLVVHD